METYRQLTLSQLDRAIAPLRTTDLPKVPPIGWVRAIREAIGMTAEQLAKRLGMTRQGLNDAERREVAGEITLAQMRRIAGSLECEVFYVLIPGARLVDIVDQRAERIAQQEVESVAHTMALEAQATDRMQQHARTAEAKRRLLARRWSRLWD